RCGDHRDRSSSRPSKVLVREVKKLLVVRIAMDRVHQRILDAEAVVNDLRYGSKAVRSAGRVGDDMVICRVIRLLIDAKRNRYIFALARSGDNNFLDRAAQVFAGISSVRE